MSNGGAQARRRRGHKARLAMQSGLCGLMVLGFLGGGVAFAQTTQVSADTAKTPVAKVSKDSKAQDKAATDANATGDTTTVTVTGQKPVNRIDRQVYDNTKDPDSKTGTALDALAKVPGVAVDPSGSITVRGKEPTILINGRPAPQLQGDNRAAALQAMSSGSITSVELSNNPGPQYGTGSSSSVINLITTSVLPPGGNISAQMRSTGGYSLFGNGHYQVGDLSLNGNLSNSSDKNISRNGSARRALDSNGNTLRSTESNSRSENQFNNTNAFFNADYRIDKDTLSAGLNYFSYNSDGDSTSNSVIYNVAGAATDVYKSNNHNENGSENQTASLTWSHVGLKPGETLKIDWRASQGSSRYAFSGVSQYSLSTIASNLAGLKSNSQGATRTGNSTFSVDYNVPIGDDQLSTGLQITTDTNVSKSTFAAPGAISFLSNSEFDYAQTISAFYASYQKPFGDHWIILGGLRVEVFELDGNAALVNLTNHVSYTTYNPSLYATYVISEKAKLRLSYAHRLQRPYASDYNPQTIQTSLTNINVGQANLKPQDTDSYEAGYEYSDKGTSYSLRGYYTHETGIVINVSTFVADPLNLGNLVVRSGRQNAGTRDTVGSEFNFNGKLTPKLSLRFSANLSDVSLDTPNFKGTKSISGLTGNLGLNYQINTKDRAYVSYNIGPRALNTDGYRSGYGSIGFQYAHKFSQSLNLTASFTDLGRSQKYRYVTSTPTYAGYSISSRQAPTFYVALSKTFGGPPSPNATSRPTVVGGSGSGGSYIRF